jgi:hypothetical protein
MFYDVVQLRTVLVVPPVHTILLDDIEQDARSAYLSVLDFLGVDDDSRSQFGVENPARQLRSRLLEPVPRALQRIKDHFGMTRNLGVGEIIAWANKKIRPWPPLSDDMRCILEDHFRDDILLLERLLERDLSHWFAQTPERIAPMK